MRHLSTGKSGIKMQTLKFQAKVKPAHMKTMKKAIYKVPNGKLLKIFLDEETGVIRDIKITGDFFIYPEENIERLEKYLCGTQLADEALRGRCRDFVEKFPTTFFGLDIDSLVATILNAAIL